MTRFDDIDYAKVTYERDKGGEGRNLQVNLVDVSRDEFQAMNKILHNHDKQNFLPNCEVDFNPGEHKAAKLINALERRGFEVEFNKENRTIEISKELKLGEMAKEFRVGKLDFTPRHDFRHGHLQHDHANTFGWRERLAWRAAKNAYEA